MDIEKRKLTGAFYTPKIWVDLSHKYLEDTLGIDWQDEYYIWDCAAGTGNLLGGLKNPNNVWASTLEFEDVETMKERPGLNLLKDHVFQFDFLNDSFDKLPKDLFEIISNEDKRKKLIVYINPPYAEASNGLGSKIKPKNGVSNRHNTYVKYKEILKSASTELFSHFLIRIYMEINGCLIAEFSKLKILLGLKYVNFRQVFKAKLLKLFLVPSNTFYNVKGEFPIGFFIFDTSKKEYFTKIEADVYDNFGNSLPTKVIYNLDGKKFISHWIKSVPTGANNVGYINVDINAKRGQRLIYITAKKSYAPFKFFEIGEKNLIDFSIYYSIAHCFKVTWLTECDLIMYPIDDYKYDLNFQSNCLAFTLFKNDISSEHIINHWIPFTEAEVNAQGKFESNFMTDFIETNHIQFSKEAQAVLNAGREIWKYYHSQSDINVNASFYDIKEYFQGRNKSGIMNKSSKDTHYNKLLTELRVSLNILKEFIKQKGYEYGFFND